MLRTYSWMFLAAVLLVACGVTATNQLEKAGSVASVLTVFKAST